MSLMEHGGKILLPNPSEEIHIFQASYACAAQTLLEQSESKKIKIAKVQHAKTA